MKNISAHQYSSKIKRLFSWIIIYILIFGIFLFIIYEQSKKVNTYQFAPGTIQLSVSKTKYVVGQTISYTLKNELTVPIVEINHCPSEPFHTYQWTNFNWVRIHDKTNPKNCLNTPKEQKILENKTITGNFNNFPNLFSKPGIYRIVAYADNYDGLAYADFEVVDKASSNIPIIIYKPVYTPVYTPVYVPVQSSGGDGGGGGGGDN